MTSKWSLVSHVYKIFSLDTALIDVKNSRMCQQTECTVIFQNGDRDWIVGTLGNIGQILQILYYVAEIIVKLQRREGLKCGSAEKNWAFVAN